MIEICIINRFLNTIAMLGMIHFLIKLYLVSTYSKTELLLYFLAIVMTTMQIMNDFILLMNPVEESYRVLYPLTRNYIFVWIFYQFYKFKKQSKL